VLPGTVEVGDMSPKKKVYTKRDTFWWGATSYKVKAFVETTDAQIIQPQVRFVQGEDLRRRNHLTGANHSAAGKISAASLNPTINITDHFDV
jgi:hypothetical protein